MDKKISIKKALEQVKVWINDVEQDYVNLDYAWKWLRVIDNAIQENMSFVYIDYNDDLYIIKDGLHCY